MIKEITTPNLDALEKITEDWVRKFQEGTYSHKEAVFAQEMVKFLRARVVADTSPEATPEPPKGNWWAFWNRRRSRR